MPDLTSITGLGNPARTSDGTCLSGFVTADTNKPPRECWHCRWMFDQACMHSEVTQDEEIGYKYGIERNDKGFWQVPEDACCDNFQSDDSKVDQHNLDMAFKESK